MPTLQPIILTDYFLEFVIVASDAPVFKNSSKRRTGKLKRKEDSFRRWAATCM